MVTIKRVLRSLLGQRPATATLPTTQGLAANKLEIIDYTFPRRAIRTFVDLGGAWAVDGGYTFYALQNHEIESATLVDTHPTRNLLTQAATEPRLRIIQGNFGSPTTFFQVPTTDAIFLFDVLLHQVAPDWNEVIEMYAPKTRCFLVYNPQWVGPGSTVRLLDLGEQGYFENIPCGPSDPPYDALFEKLDTANPDHDRPWRDTHPIWQWGITNADLQAKMESLGFRMQFMKNCGRFLTLQNFESYSFVFTRDR